MHDAFLGFYVEVGGGFVEEHDGGVFQDCAGDRDALALAAGQPAAALASGRVVAVRERGDPFAQASVACRGLHFRVAGVGAAEQDVVAKGFVEDVAALRDDGEALLHGFQRQVRKRPAADGDFTRLRVPVAQEQVDER